MMWPADILLWIIITYICLINSDVPSLVNTEIGCKCFMAGHYKYVTSGMTLL